MRIGPVLGGFYLATQRIKDSNGNVIAVECACLPGYIQAMRQCVKQCKEHMVMK